MKNKGFTLIELLAVIVILSIIALIVLPLVMGIVNDSMLEANKRSIDNYAAAVKNAMATYQLKEFKKPTNFEEIEPYVSYKGDKVECDTVNLYLDGKIYLTDCTVDGKEVDYEYGKVLACTVVKQDPTKYSIGDEVSCKIGETVDKFYVIEDAELSATSVQMLTEKNINTTTYRQSDNAGTSKFASTNYWSGVTNYPVDVYNKNSLLYTIVEEYVSYLNTKLTGATGSLLTYSQAKNLGCDFKEQTCGPQFVGQVALENPAPEWVYSTAYWLGSAAYSQGVWRVGSNGYLYDITGGNTDFGVRPVITISTSDI